MKRFTAVAVIAIALLCHACNNTPEAEQKPEVKEVALLSRSMSEEESSAVTNNSNEEYEQHDKQQGKKKQPSSSQSSPAQTYADWDRKIIRTANVETEVKDLKLYTAELRTSIRQLGGYVAAEQFSSGPYKLSGSLTLKVPVESFEQAVSLVSAKTIAVNNVNIQSQDVSTELVDVKARLEVRRTMRDRYIQLMQGAKSMEDLLKVQAEVNGIQEEIESGMSRVNYLSHASALSTIHLSCFQMLQPEPEKKEESRNKVKEAFLTGWELVGNLLIGLVTIWPALLLVAVGILVVRTRLKSKK